MLISVIALAAIIKITYDRYAVKEVAKQITVLDKPSYYKWSLNKFYIDELYDRLIVQPFAWCGNAFEKYIEHPIIDGAVNRFGNVGLWIGNQLRMVQTGNIGWYLVIMVAGIIVMLIYGLTKLNVL